MAPKLPAPWLLTPLLLCACLGGCEPARPPTGASAEKPHVEADLARTTLSRAAEKSLGIKTEPVRIEQLQEHRPLTGWVVARPGDEVVVTAPLGGVLSAPASGGLPPPGSAVKKGRELFRLTPVLTPVEEIQMAGVKRGVESDLKKAKESVHLAESELKRIESLFAQKLRGEQDVEQVRAKVKHAMEDLATAEDKLKVLTAALGGNEPQPITAPRDGVVLALHASPGQFVAAAAPLATVADLTKPWVRVAVPEADLDSVDRSRPATVRSKKVPRALTATPVAEVPQVDPLRRTADLIYAVDAPGLAKDEILTVLVPFGKKTRDSVVPYSAILYDAYGGSWVYIDRTKKDAPQLVYERVRVEVGAGAGDNVVVRPSLAEGERVVIEGAAALFSREFHRPPVVVPEEAGKK